MRLILIAVVALMVLGGGGAGAYYYFNNQAQAAANAGKAVEKADKKDHSESKDVEYVRLDPLILPVIDSEGLTQVVTLVVAIEVTNKKDTELVQRLIPRITDAMIQEMYGQMGKNALKDGAIQVDYIKERLNKISTKVIGADIINGVLLQVVQQRPA